MRSSTQHQRPKRSYKTRRRVTNQEGAIPDLHSTLWSSYRRSDGGSQPAPDPTHPTLAHRPLPALLKRHADKIPRPLLAIAVWNQVPSFNPDVSVAPPTLDDTLEELLASVLDLRPDDACTLRASQLFDAFPPYPDQMILDAL